jgi:hypothetical protein
LNKRATVKFKDELSWALAWAKTGTKYTVFIVFSAIKMLSTVGDRIGHKELVGSISYYSKVAGYERNIQQCLSYFSTPELKSPCQIALIIQFQKCHTILTLGQKRMPKLRHFQCKLLRLLAVALFCSGQQQFRCKYAV